MVDNVTDMVHRRRAANGERMTGFKLTDSDVVEIRHVFATKGTSKAELARRYGVSRTLIRRVLNYTIRTAVTNPPLPESDR
jgi:response regulator of citrate/malate metabolism